MPPTATTTPVTELVRRGRITEAVELLAAVPEPDVECRCLQLECHLARGEMRRAKAVAEQLSDKPPSSPGHERRSALALARLAAADGHDDEALHHLDRVAEVSDPDDDPVDSPWRAEASLSLIRLGRRREAVELAEQHLALATASGSAYATASAIRTAAAVCVSSDRREQLREAHGLVAGSYLRLAAQLATDLAGLIALTAQGASARDEAVTLLRGAERYADREDLWPLHNRVRRLLERLGEPALVPRSETVARLSEAELRIARLAAAGETNRAIGGRLGVTSKCVEWHLSNTYRKLEVAGRNELAALLREP